MIHSSQSQSLHRTLAEWIAIGLVAVLIVCGSSPVCRGQFRPPDILSTTKVILPIADPTGARGVSSGFDATINVSNLFGVGYVGVRAQFDSTRGPLSTTREFVIRLTPIDRHLPAERSIATELPLTFQQGQSQATIERAFPKWTIGNSFRIEISEDGVPLPDYAAEVGSVFPGYVTQSPSMAMPDEITCNFAFIDSKPMEPYKGTNSISTQQSKLRSWTSHSLESFPDDWRLLRDVDCIVIDSKRLGDPDDQRINAIRDWVMLGGTLVVLRAPELTELSRSLRFSLPRLESDQNAFQSFVANEIEDAHSDLAKFKSWHNEVRGRAAVGKGNSGGLISSDPQLSDLEQIENSNEADVEAFEANWAESYRRSVGIGHVIGLRGSSPVAVSSLELIRNLIGYQTSSMLQRGVDPLMGDSRSRRWLIPGISEPPVYTFMGILTLFVLLVGPVAYRWTTLGHRSHLMFLIAPALALITTATMFAYSIISDGFGTIVRVRQLTWIDGASGDAVERTRSTLFSGISPRDGLQFSTDAEVMIYPSGGQLDWKDLSSDASEARLRSRIEDNVQNFGSSVLPSRTQTQFVSHRVRRNLGAITIAGLLPLDSDDQAADDESVTFSSSLSFELRDLVARSHDGRYWSIDKLGAGDSVAATWIEKGDDSSKLLGNLYNRYRLVGAVSQTSGGRRRGQVIRDLILYMNRQVSPNGTVVTDGTFERWLNESLFIKGDLPPGMFVAISSPSSDVVPVNQAEQVESIRYVMGTLR